MKPSNGTPPVARLPDIHAPLASLVRLATGATVPRLKIWTAASAICVPAPWLSVVTVPAAVICAGAVVGNAVAAHEKSYWTASGGASIGLASIGASGTMIRASGLLSPPPQAAKDAIA